MTTTVTALYKDLEAAERAASKLVEAGFGRRNISVIFASTPDHRKLVGKETEDAPRGLLAGALGGGVLASLGFTVLGLPGLAVMATGPLVVALAAGSAGALVGGVVGAMIGHGLSVQVAEDYESALTAGAVLVAVHTVHSRIRRTRRLLEAYGGRDVSDSVHASHEETREAEA